MKKGLSFIITIAVSILMAINVGAHVDLSKSDIAAYLDVISARQMSTITNPKYGSVGGEWTVIGLARYGTITKSYIEIYKDNLKVSLQKNNGELSDTRYTEYARVVMALTSINENPQKFGGYNLLQPLAEYDVIEKQGLNGLIYTLIALDCGDYEIPSPKSNYNGTKTTREKLKENILDRQNSDGGWSFAGSASDPDMTAMTIQALSAYYSKDSKITNAVDNAILFLSKVQNKNGDYCSGSTPNCESTAQVLTAMASVGIKASDSLFIKNGKTVLDGIMQYYTDGAFKHVMSGKANQLATDQAMYALVAYYRSLDNENSIYDMSDGIQTKKISKESAKKVKTITKKYKASKTKTKKEKPATTKKVEETSSKKKESKKKKIAESKQVEAQSETYSEAEEKRTIEKTVTYVKKERKTEILPILCTLMSFTLIIGMGVVIYEKKKHK